MHAMSANILNEYREHKLGDLKAECDCEGRRPIVESGYWRRQRASIHQVWGAL